MSLPPRFSKLAEKSKPTFKTYSCKAGRIISGRLFNPFSIEDGHGGFLQWGHPQNQRFQYKNGLNFGWFGDPPQEKKAPWIFGCHSWRCRYLSPGQVSNPGIEVGRWGPVRRHSRSLFLIFHGATSPLLWHGKKQSIMKTADSILPETSQYRAGAKSLKEHVELNRKAPLIPCQAYGSYIWAHTLEIPQKLRQDMVVNRWKHRFSVCQKRCCITLHR